jgi:hypothetical protein
MLLQLYQTDLLAHVKKLFFDFFLVSVLHHDTLDVAKIMPEMKSFRYDIMHPFLKLLVIRLSLGLDLQGGNFWEYLTTLSLV